MLANLSSIKSKEYLLTSRRQLSRKQTHPSEIDPFQYLFAQCNTLKMRASRASSGIVLFKEQCGLSVPWLRRRRSRI
jgi:hypothetical protein